MYNPYSGACAAFASISEFRSSSTIVNGISTWKGGMPWLMYPTGSQNNKAPCFDTRITISMNLNEKVTVDE